MYSPYIPMLYSAREPGESEADYELRRRDYRQSRSRCILSSTSEEEEEKKEKREKKEEEKEEVQAAGAAAGPSSSGAAASAALELKEKEEKTGEKKRAPKTKETRGKGPLPGTRPSPKPLADPPRPLRNFLRVETKRRVLSPDGTNRPAVILTNSEFPTARTTDRKPSHTFEVRGLSAPRQPSELVEGAPWRNSTLK